MTSIQDKIEQADRKCSQNGARLTVKRKLVLSSLLLCDKAMSAYDIVAHCKQTFGEVIHAMSVYRILDFLEQQQLVHKLNLANKYIACCHIDCDHSHDVPQFLICSVCQRVKEISLGKITEEELKQDVEEAGFHLLSPQLEINCICEKCVNDAV